jgi:hypothetical protein
MGVDLCLDSAAAGGDALLTIWSLPYRIAQLQSLLRTAGVRVGKWHS